MITYCLDSASPSYPSPTVRINNPQSSLVVPDGAWYKDFPRPVDSIDMKSSFLETISEIRRGSTLVWPAPTRTIRFTVHVEGFVTFQLYGTGITVNFGDGTIVTKDCLQGSGFEHFYSSPGTKTIGVTGRLYRLEYQNYSNWNAYGGYLIRFESPTYEFFTAKELFYGTTNLESVPPDFAESTETVSDYTRCFMGCSSLTGYAPALWEKEGAIGTECFRGCTGLTNYADIPDTWK